MQVPVHQFEWRVLRQVLRSKKPPPGSSLRLEMTRRTRDGEHLVPLVRLGLLKVEAKGKTPVESTYTLTDRGKHAAEYGVYDIEFEEYKAATNGKK
jgi:hypothetical protein